LGATLRAAVLSASRVVAPSLQTLKGMLVAEIISYTKLPKSEQWLGQTMEKLLKAAPPATETQQ